jgi:hypothetical protein
VIAGEAKACRRARAANACSSDGCVAWSGLIAHRAQPPDSPPELVFVGFAVLGVLEGLAARCSRAWGRARASERRGAASVARRDVAGVGVSSDVIGSGGLALGEVDRSAHEVGDAMVSRRDFDRPVAGSGGEASLRRRAVMRGRVVVGGVAVRLVLARRAIGHGEPERWLLGQLLVRGARVAYGCS